MTHHWIDTSLPQWMRDKHPVLAAAPAKIEQCFFCFIVKTAESAATNCDKRPSKAEAHKE